MARIILGLARERTAGDDRLPFLRRPHEIVRANLQPLLSFRFQKRFKRRAGILAGIEDYVPALQQRARIGKAQRREHRLEIRHGDAAPTDIDRAEESDVGGHARRTSRISSTGHSGAVVPEHRATVFASSRSSFRRSPIFARMSWRWRAAMSGTSPHEAVPGPPRRTRVRMSSSAKPSSRALRMKPSIRTSRSPYTRRPL